MNELTARDTLALAISPVNEGTAMLARMATMAITTSNSTSVKPRWKGDSGMCSTGRRGVAWELERFSMRDC